MPASRPTPICASPPIRRRQAQAIDLYTAFGEAVSWASPELLAVGKAKIDGFVASNATLKKRFDFALADTLRQADHTLSPESENLLAGRRRAVFRARATSASNSSRRTFRGRP